MAELFFTEENHLPLNQETIDLNKMSLTFACDSETIPGEYHSVPGNSQMSGFFPDEEELDLSTIYVAYNIWDKAISQEKAESLIQRYFQINQYHIINQLS